MEEDINKRPRTGLIVLLVVAAIVIIGLVGLVFYFVGKVNSLEDQLDSTEVTASPSTNSAGIVSTETPKAVADSFMNYTLGTLPDADVDLDAAREYLDSSLASKYSGDGFVPLFYGIQDGPTEVAYVSENTTGSSSSVKYNATFGDTMLGWVFTLTETSDGWKISGFTNDAQ